MKKGEELLLWILHKIMEIICFSDNVHQCILLYYYNKYTFTLLSGTNVSFHRNQQTITRLKLLRSVAGTKRQMETLYAQCMLYVYALVICFPHPHPMGREISF